MNDWELNTPEAQLRFDDQTDSCEVVAIHVGHSRIVGLSTSDLELLARLAKTLADIIEQQLEVERQRLLAWVKKNIPLAKLVRRLREKTKVPGTRGIQYSRAR